MKNKIFSLTPADPGVCKESWNYAGELCLGWKKKQKSAAKQLVLVADALLLFNKYFQAFFCLNSSVSFLTLTEMVLL